MITQQQTADYINMNINSSLTEAEMETLRSAITPELATILIKLLGDVAFLTEIRDN